MYLTDAGLLAVLLQTSPVSRTEGMAKTRALPKTFPCVPAVFRHYFPRGEMIEAGADMVSLTTADAQPPLYKACNLFRNYSSSESHLNCPPGVQARLPPHRVRVAGFSPAQRRRVHYGSAALDRPTARDRHLYYAELIPLRDGDDTLRMNWCELTTTDEHGNALYHHAFATSLALNERTVLEIVAARCYRWKIENEHNNTLKTKGYYKVG